MTLVLQILACLAGLAIIVCIVMQTSTADAGFSAAMGGGGGGDSSAHKGGTDLMLERIIKVAAIVWIAVCLALAVMGAHAGGGPAV